MSEPLGLDSITFDTFDWEHLQSDETMRAWQGDAIVLVENFFALPPDIPSLEPDALRAAYRDAADESSGRRGWMLRRLVRREGERTREIIEVAVTHKGVVPIVRSIMRLPLPDQYLFSAALTVPLAECSWAIQVQALEVMGQLTGVREAVAFAEFMSGNAIDAGDADAASGRVDADPLADVMSGFDPYDARWDGLVDDPLSRVRRHIHLVERSLAFAPAVSKAKQFG